MGLLSHMPQNRGRKAENHVRIESDLYYRDCRND